jgi:hypothetical protein
LGAAAVVGFAVFAGAGGRRLGFLPMISGNPNAPNQCNRQLECAKCGSKGADFRSLCDAPDFFIGGQELST